jgi:hypothetical protein
VATATQRRPITLHGPGLEIRFIKGRVDDLDADLTTTVLGDVLVTSIEQTILDLAHPACRGPRQKRTERRSSRSPEGCSHGAARAGCPTEAGTRSAQSPTGEPGTA